MIPDPVHPYLIVGEAPGREPGPPLSGRIGAKLARLAGIDRLEERFDLANLLDDYPGPAGKGAAFPREDARYAARELWAQWHRWQGVILLGRRVADAFRIPRPFEVCAWYLELHPYGTSFAIVPHPSGVNRWYNDPANVALAERFLRSVVAEQDDEP